MLSKYLLLILAVCLMVGTVQPVSAEYYKYYAYGDSITSATGCGDLPSNGTKAYVMQMRDIYDPLASAAHSMDGGGYTSQDGVDHLADHWDADGIGLIFISFGVNDFDYSIPATTVVDNEIEIYNYAESRGTQAIILLPPISPVKNYATYSAYIEDIQDGLIAAGVKYAPVYDYIDSDPNNGTINTANVTNFCDPANSHLNITGHLAVANGLWARMAAYNVSITNTGWLMGWDHRQGVTINGSTANLTNYQMNLSVYNTTGTSSGSAIYLGAHAGDSENFNDIRITDNNSAILAEWNESARADGWEIWGKIPSIPTTGTKIYIYYGNSTASAAWDGNSTFLFYDHFDTPTLDTTKWTKGGTGSVSDSIYTMSGTTGSIQSVGTHLNATGDNKAVRTRMNSSHFQNTTYYESFNPKTYSSNSTAYISAFFSHTTALGKKYRSRVASTNTDTAILGWSADTFHVIDCFMTDKTVWKVDNDNTVTVTTNYPTENAILRYATASDVNSSESVDWVFVRNYMETEPAFSTWAEEESAPCTAEIVASRTSGLVPLNLTFLDASTTMAGSLTNWSWDFGDGTNSTDQNPGSHIYRTPGYYNVSLQVTNSLGETSWSNQTNYIHAIRRIWPVQGITPENSLQYNIYLLLRNLWKYLLRLFRII